MSGYVDCGVDTAVAGEALQAFRCVKFSADNTVIYADSGDAPDAITRSAAANGSVVDIAYLNKQGTTKAIASTSIAISTKVYCTDDGKVTDTDAGSDVVCGKTIETAAADGDEVVIQPILAS